MKPVLEVHAREAKFDLSSSLSSRVLFVGNGLLSKSNYEVSSYVQDTWMVKPKLLVEAGVRQDWDAILGTTTVTPRLAAAWAHWRWRRSSMTSKPRLPRIPNQPTVPSRRILSRG